MTITKEEFVREAIDKDATLKRKLFSDELDRYMKNYKTLHDNYQEFTKLINELHNFPSKEVPQFINKLMPVVMANLSQKHEIVVKLDKGNSWSNRVLVATAQGIRSRSENGYHTQDLTAKTIKDMFITKGQDIENWIKVNKPKKLQDWVDFRNAFINGFKEEYCDDGDRGRYSSSTNADEDKSTMEIDKKIPERELSWINQNNRGYSIEREPFDVDEISIRYNIPRSHGCIYFLNEQASKSSRGILSVSDSGYMEFDSTDALKMMEMRELFPMVNQIIDEAKVKMEADNKLSRAWWAQFNKTMNKWVSMINL